MFTRRRIDRKWLGRSSCVLSRGSKRRVACVIPKTTESSTLALDPCWSYRICALQRSCPKVYAPVKVEALVADSRSTSVDFWVGGSTNLHVLAVLSRNGHDDNRPGCCLPAAGARTCMYTLLYLTCKPCTQLRQLWYLSATLSRTLADCFPGPPPQSPAG